MKKEDILKQGELFYHANETHEQIDPPCVQYPDMDYDDAYAVQSAFVDKLVREKGYHISGKKVGLTSKAMRKLSNINEPDYGYMFHELCYANDAQIPASKFIEPRVECELAFKLKKDLDHENITRQDVIDATEYVVTSMEICDFRMYRDKVQRLIYDSIADNAAFGAYVLGDVPFDPKTLDLGMVPFIFEVNNRQVEVSCGAAVYDDPALSVAWLANKFYQLGNPLKANEIILSGSAVASLPATAGDHFRCRFGKLGDVSCRFVE